MESMEVFCWFAFMSLHLLTVDESVCYLCTAL